MNWDAPLNFEIDFKDGKFHTIGFEWMPEHLTIYVDGIAIRSTNWKQDLMCSMNIILDIYAGSGFNGSPNENTIFPFYYEIDYIHYYKLKSTENKNYIYTNKSTYDEIAKHIYQSITISKESKPSLKSSKNSSLKKQNIKLRATEEIILDEGFETEDGAEFLAFIEQFFTCTEFPLGKRSSISSTSLINQQKVEEFNSAQEKSIISFYPNPTQGVTNVNASFQNNGSFEIIILDASGQILKTEIFKLDESELKINFPLNFSIYSQGIYFIQIKTLNEIKTFKLIKI